MDNKELLISSALRNILFQTDLDTRYLDNLRITRRIREILLMDCDMYDRTDTHVNDGRVIKDLIENIPITDNVELSKEELNYFFIRAIMYATPRQTYIVGVAKEWTEEYLEELTKETKETAIEIIKNARIPDDHDKDIWNMIKIKLGGE